jgi:hypothetical protein
LQENVGNQEDFLPPIPVVCCAKFMSERQPQAKKQSSRLLGLAVLLCPALILIWHSLQYNFVTDDAYISFVFSENFAEHGQLVFNPGQNPVEGYTNFLWTFVLGLFMLVGLPPEVMSLVLGTAFAMGTLVVVYRLYSHLCGQKDQGTEQVWAGLAPLLLAMSSGFACWSSGGLETQMFTFFVSFAFYAYARGNDEPRWYRLLGLSLALAAMTRPEGLLVTAVIGVHRLAINLIVERRLKPMRAELVCVLVFLLVWGPWFLWRFWYYGHLFPNTYYVKAAGDASAGYAAQMHANGWYYLRQWVTQSKAMYAAPVAVIGLLPLGLRRLGNEWQRSTAFVFGSAALVLAAVYIFYVARVGGDFMGLHRFVMPLFVITALGFVLGLRTLSSYVPRTVTLAAVLVCVGLFGFSQFRLTQESLRWGNWKSDRGIDTPAYLATYAHDRKRIGEHMRECFRPDDFSIFGGVGAKPYHAKARGIDVFGLVSERIAHEVPRTIPRAGHNKWASNSFLFKVYNPDFVFHCYSLHTDPLRPAINCGAGGTRYWQSKGFEQVTLHIPGLLERGEYYTFFVSGERVESFRATCPGVVTGAVQ